MYFFGLFCWPRQTQFDVTTGNQCINDWPGINAGHPAHFRAPSNRRSPAGGGSGQAALLFVTPRQRNPHPAAPWPCPRRSHCQQAPAIEHTATQRHNCQDTACNHAHLLLCSLPRTQRTASRQQHGTTRWHCKKCTCGASTGQPPARSSVVALRTLESASSLLARANQSIARATQPQQRPTTAGTAMYPQIGVSSALVETCSKSLSPPLPGA